MGTVQPQHRLRGHTGAGAACQRVRLGVQGRRAACRSSRFSSSVLPSSSLSFLASSSGVSICGRRAAVWPVLQPHQTGISLSDSDEHRTSRPSLSQCSSDSGEAPAFIHKQERCG